MGLQVEAEEAVARLRFAGTDLQEIEVKAAGGGLPRSATESVAAFANADGGLLLLGLDEATGFAPVAIDAGKLASDLASACADQLEPPVRAEIDIVEIDGAPVVAASVVPLAEEKKPCFVKARGMDRGSFLRTHDGDRALSTYEVHVMVASRGQPRDDTQTVDAAHPTDLDATLVASLITRLRQTRGPVFKSATDDEVLRLLDVVAADATPTGEPKITLAAVLALGRYPQQFFPQLNTTFVVYPTVTGEPMADGTRFLDNQSIDGPIPIQVDLALDAVRRNMKRRAIIAGLGREDHWEYPEEAIREAIANALIHRDYHALARGSQVRIEMYPDRLVVSNPGGLHGPISRLDLLAEPVSSSRNALLAKLLEDIEVPGTSRTVCENRGSGLIAMAAALRRAGMEPPELTDNVREFRVTLHNHGLIDDDSISWLAQLDTDGLSDRQKLGLAFLRRHGTITNQNYRTLTGCDPGVATRELAQLATRGLIAKTSSGRGTVWHLVTAAEPRAHQLTLASEPGAGSARSTPGSSSPNDNDRRSQIQDLLRNGPRSAGDLADSLGLSRQATLRWLRILEADGHVVATSPQRRSPTNRWKLPG